MKTKTVVENGFKETEIGLIPEDWETTSLENEKSFEFTNGLWKGKKAPFVTVKVVRNTNFNNDGTLSLDDVAELDVEEKQFIKRQLLGGDIILERSGGGPKQPVGRVVFFDLNERNYSFSNFTTRIRVKDINRIKPKYLLYYLLLFYDKGNTYELQQRTTGIRNLNFKEYKKIQVPLSGLEEQQKIASVLSKIQQAIEQQDKTIQTTKELKKSVMNKLFTEGLHGEEQKETEIGLISKSWELMKAEDFCERVTDGTHDTPKPASSGYFLVTSKNLKNGRIQFDNCYLISNKDYEVVNKRSKVDLYDVLFGMIGTIGSPVLIRQEPDFAIKNVGLFKTNKDMQKGLWLYHYLSSHIVDGLVDKQKAGATQKYIPLWFLRSLPIPLPKKEEMNGIVKALENIDKKIQQAEARKQALQALFKTMLNQLMTGRIRVKDLEIEVKN